jgi:ribosome maturation protein Sdo1
MRAVYTSVVKGITAKKAEIQKAFGHEDIDKVCKEILKSVTVFWIVPVF